MFIGPIAPRWDSGPEQARKNAHFYFPAPRRRATIRVSIFMRFAGFFLLIMGWIIVLAAIALLKAGAQSGFVLAGFAVEGLGLTLVVRSHLIPRGDKA